MYKSADELTYEAFKRGLNETTLSEYIKFKMTSTEKPVNTDGLPLTIDVVKMQHKVHFDCDIIITINEEIFDRLTEGVQNYIIKKTWCYVQYDVEKEVVKKIKPEFIEFDSLLCKLSYEEIEAYRIGIDNIVTEYKEELKENK